MTKKQLEKFIKIRNRSRFNTNLQFMIDATTSGFEAKELGDPVKVNGNTYQWQTPHGLLVERNGRLSLETVEAVSA